MRLNNVETYSHPVWHPIVFCDWQRPLQIAVQTYCSVAGKSRSRRQILFLSIPSLETTTRSQYRPASIGPSNIVMIVMHVDLLDSPFSYWTEIRNYNNGTPGDKRKQKCNIHFVLTFRTRQSRLCLFAIRAHRSTDKQIMSHWIIAASLHRLNKYGSIVVEHWAIGSPFNHFFFLFIFLFHVRHLRTNYIDYCYYRSPQPSTIDEHSAR